MVLLKDILYNIDLLDEIKLFSEKK